MVRKVQKSKSSNLKSSTLAKKGATETKNEEKLSNGIGDNEHELEKAKDKSEMKAAENETAASDEKMNVTETEKAKSNENMDSAPETQDDDVQMEENVTDKQEEPAEMKSVASGDVKTAPRFRKRKAAANVPEKKSTVETKAKKQKVLLNVPKINSVTGKVFVIGDNTVGQLGLGEEVTEKTRPALLDLPHSIVDIAAGAMHSICLTESGEIITFGCNDEGALGRLTTEEGSEYIPQKVDIPEHIVQVSAGDSHSAALSDSGQVYIWGNFRNNNGPMGLVTEGARQITPVKILNNVTVVKIASGSDHLSCLSREGVVYTCGNGECGQLGRVTERTSSDGGRKGKALLLTPDEVPISRSNKPQAINNIWTGSFSTYLKIQENGSIYGFGLNNYSQLGVNNLTNIWKPKQLMSFENRTWTQINGGQHHTLALDDEGLVYSLGRSEYGRLGLGEDSGEKSVPTAIPSLEDKKCIDISCGDQVSFALEDNGSVYSWGMGNTNQLGHGNEDDQYMPRLVGGNFFNSWKALKISGGGQHTLILAHPRNSLEKSQ